MAKNREKQLIKNTLIVAIGKISTQFISFFLLPLYTSVLSAKEFGIVDLLNTYVTLLLPLVFLQIDQSIFRYLIDARNNDNEKQKLITTTLIAVSIQSLVFLILFFVVSPFINNNYKYFLVLNVIASMYSTVMLQISRGLGDNMTYSLGCLITGTGTILLNIVLIVFLHFGAYGMLIASFSANILSSLFIFLKLNILKYIKYKTYSFTTIKKMLKFSVPLIPNHLSWWIINASDRTIITYILGIGSNGIYSAANKFSSICISLFGIFNITWSESASLYIKDKDSSEYFSKIINDSIRMFTALCIGIIAIMPFSFNLLITGNEYSSAYYQIPILLIATIFNITVSLFGSIYIALKKTNEIAKTSIYAAIINILINLLLIKHIDLYAASLSTLIAYLTMAIYRYRDIQKYIKIKIDKKFIIVSILLLLIILKLYYLKNIFLCTIGLFAIIIYSIYFNKKILIIIVKKLKINCINIKSSMYL